MKTLMNISHLEDFWDGVLMGLDMGWAKIWYWLEYFLIL